MMEDIVGDYKDKTVTLEDFPFFDTGVKMASVHPCRHASVMKVLLDRADAALKIRLRKQREGMRDDNTNTKLAAAEGRDGKKVESGLEGLVDDTARMTLTEREKTSNKAFATGVAAAGGAGGDEWEVLQHEAGGNGPGAGADDEVAIRVDQYLVVFLKFMGSVMPAIEHDFTTGI